MPPRMSKLEGLQRGFNMTYHVGDRLKVRLDSGIEERVLAEPATILGGHSVVIWLEGVTGCYDIKRVLGKVSDA